MPLEPAEKQFFAELAKEAKKNPPKPVNEMSIEEFREVGKVFLQFAGKPEDIPFTDKTIPARDGYKVPIRVYGDDGDISKPAVILFPGNGFMIDLFEQHHAPCSIIAKHSGCKVILVNFRLIPENPFPTGLNDATDATKYIMTHTEEFGIDKNKIIIAGFSAGANFAAIINNQARNIPELNIHHQILIAGPYDLSASLKTHLEYEEEDQLCTQEAIDFLLSLYVPDNISNKDPNISPYWEENLNHLPPTTIFVAEYDRGRSQSEGYFEKLKTAGVPVTKIIFKGQTHNTLICRKVLNGGKDPAMVIAKRLQEITA